MRADNWFKQTRQKKWFVAGAAALICMSVCAKAAPDGAVRVLTVDPYRDVAWDTVKQSRAGLHTHTTVSDGAMAPHRVVDEYHQRGYAILAFTDHNRTTYPWTAFDQFNASYENRDPAALGMLAIPGNELSRHHHLQSLFTTFESTGTDIDAVLAAQRLSANSARAILNHPAWHWTRSEPATGFKVPMQDAMRQLPQGDFSVEAWFRCSDADRNVLLGNYATAYQGAINLELHTDNRLRLYLQNTTGRVIDRNLSGGAIDTRDGQWHHAAGVRKAGKVMVYLDGQQLGDAVNDTLGAYTLQGGTFWLGRDTRDGSTEFNGDLDQMRLWARGLDAAEVALLAAGSGPNAGVTNELLLAEYGFDRPAQVDDTAGHAEGPFHATCVEQGYRVPLAAAMRHVTRGDFTLGAWFRTTDTGRNILMGNYVNGTLGALNLELHNNNRIRVYLQPPSGQGKTTVDLFATPSVNTRDGRWRHLVSVRRGSVVYLYLDGEELAQAPDTAGTFDLQNDALYLGRDARLGVTVFKGDCDAWQIWNRALTPAELAQAATDGRAATLGFSGLVARYNASPATFARDTAGHVDGPFDAQSDAFSSALRIYDVAAPLAVAGTSAGAIRLGWSPPYPISVPSNVVDTFAGLFQRHSHLVGMEVLNGTMAAREYPLDRELWDKLLTRMMPARPIWGFANDDMHSMTHLGRDSVSFLIQELNEAAVLQAFDRGAFTFASTRVKSVAGNSSAAPPRMERIVHDVAAGTLTLAATSEDAPLPDSAYTWISGGEVVHTGPVLAYRAVGTIGGYVRAEIAGPGGTLYTNPFGFSMADATADADSDLLPDWWELAYFGDTVSVVADTVSLSGMTMREHYIVGSDPRDPDARFRIVGITPGGAGADAMRTMNLRWPSAAGRRYAVEHTSDLRGAFALLDGAETLAASPPYNEYEVPCSNRHGFFRVRVQLAE